MYIVTALKNRNRKILYFVFLLFLTSGLTMTSCSKDEYETMKQNKISFVSDVVNYNENNIEKRDGQDETNYLIPSSSELLEIAEYLEESENGDIWMTQFVEVYGFPIWSHSIKSNVTDSSYTVSIPVIQQNKVLGVMRYINHPDCIHAYFRGYTHITNVPNLNYSEYEIGREKTLVLNFIYFQYVVEGAYNQGLKEWVDVIESNSNEETSVSIRSEMYCWEIIEWHLEHFGYADDPYMWTDVVITDTYIECVVIGGPGVGINDPAGTTDPDIIINPDDSIRSKTEQEKEEKIEDCLNRMSAQVKAAFDQAISSLEEEYGNKICFDNIKKDLLTSLIWDGTIDCDNPDADVIRANFEYVLADKASEFENTVKEIRESDITDPCNPYLTSDDIANNALASMQESGGCGVEGLESALNSNDYIDKGNLAGCDLLNCIYIAMNGVADGATENLICDIFSSFQNGSSINLNFHVDYEREALAIRDGEGNIIDYPLVNENSGSTQASSMGSTIFIHPDFCDGGVTGNYVPFYAAAIMYHEMIHAEFYSWISEAYPDLYNFKLPSNANASNSEYWNKVLNANLPDAIGNTNQHNVMQYLLNDIATSLYELNGKEGNVSDYLYWAHLTLNSVKHNPNFSQGDLNALKTIFDTNVVLPNGHKNNFGC